MNSNCTQFTLRNPASKTGSCRSVRLCIAAIIGLAFAAVNATFAQVSTINSVFVQPGILDSTNLPDAALTQVTNYPSLISFSATNAGINTTNTAFSPIQDLWEFSSDGGLTAYEFQSNDYFTVYMNVTLTGDPISPRKEAGFAFNDVNGGINGQYILDTDGHEVVAFGGNLPFYASPLDGSFQSGDTITMGITMFKDSNGNNAIIYSANGISSGVLEFGAGSPPAPYTLGGYFQLQGQSVSTNVITPATNYGSAVFQNIKILTQPTLNIAQNGNLSVLYWPAAAANFTLQTSTSLSSTNWTTVPTNGAFVIGVAVTNSSSNSFYRLISPQ
jgi:hypothetical protein